MIFLDKIYFKIYRAYKYKFRDSDPEIYAISYLAVMTAFHIIALLKILTLFGMEIDTKVYSKIQKIGAIILLFLIFGIRYYFFFDSVKFEKKYGFSDNYTPLILYTGLFLITFFVLILVF